MGDTNCIKFLSRLHSIRRGTLCMAAPCYRDKGVSYVALSCTRCRCVHSCVCVCVCVHVHACVAVVETKGSVT